MKRRKSKKSNKTAFGILAGIGLLILLMGTFNLFTGALVGDDFFSFKSSSDDITINRNTPAPGQGGDGTSIVYNHKFQIYNLKPIEIYPDTKGNLTFQYNEQIGDYSGCWGIKPYNWDTMGTGITIQARINNEVVASRAVDIQLGACPYHYQCYKGVVPTQTLELSEDIEGGYHTVDLFWSKPNWRSGDFSENCLSPISTIASASPEYLESWHNVATTKLYKEDNSCTPEPGEMIVTESFPAGQTLTKQDLRYPVKAFCHTIPLLKIEAGKMIEQSYTEYDLLNNGSYVTVPVNQTWTFFYVIDVDPEITVVCEEGDYDPVTQECVVRPGIIHVCSAGIFDPLEGLCIVQPNSRYICEIGYYDTEEQLCIYQIPKDKVIILCPENSLYDEGRDACIYTPSTGTVCEKGYYDSQIDKCIYVPDISTQCPDGTNWDEPQNACLSEGKSVFVCESGNLDTSVSPPVCKQMAETQFPPITEPVQDVVDTINQSTGLNFSLFQVIGLMLLVVGIIGFVMS